MNQCHDCTADAVEGRARCPRHLEAARAHATAYYRRNRDRIRAENRANVRAVGEAASRRDYRLLAKYGITGEEYDAMEREQDGKCAICKQPERRYGSHGKVKRLAVDHCHETGKVRGLLCADCNTAIGLLGDNPERVEAARAYLVGKSVRGGV